MNMKSDAARALSLSRKRKRLKCEVCDKSFLARDRRAKYCSNACKCSVRNAKVRAAKAAAKKQ